ncbi:MAG: lipopolysaccharide biosynthesis protein [Sarcina sp.]
MEKLKKMFLNKLGRNFLVVLFGTGVGSIISLINLSIMIHTIGLKGNGMIIMLQTYIGLFVGIFSFKSFEAIIKHISVTIETGDDTKTKEYIKFSFMLDIISVILAFIFSYIFMDLVFKWMEWPNYLAGYMKIYIIAILFSGTGTATGIIRIYNKFGMMVRLSVATLSVKLIFYIIGYFIHGGVGYFFILEFVFGIILNILIIGQAFFILRKEKMGDFYKVKLKFDKEYFKFNVYSSLYTTLDMPVGQITTFIINRYLGFSEVGVYNIFTKLGSIIVKLESPLSQIIFPEMNVRVAQGEKQGAVDLYKKIFKTVAMVGVGVTIVVLATYVLWMPIFITDYQLYFVAFAIYMIYLVYTSASRTIHDLFITLGYIRVNVLILLIVNICYLFLLFWLAQTIKLEGVIIALFIQAIAVIEIKKIILKRDKHL